MFVNEALHQKAKRMADQVYGKHTSAYKSGFMVKTYKQLGGTFNEGEQKLKRWFNEKWRDIGHQEYPVYRPTKRVSKDTPLTPNEIDPKNLRKQIALKQKIKGKTLPAFVKR
jgi:hypothetical protein